MKVRRKVGIITRGNNGIDLAATPVRRRGPFWRLAGGCMCLVVLWPSNVLAELPSRSGHRTSREPRAEVASPGAEDFYRLGEEALTAGRYKQSIQFLKQAAVHRPSDVELHYWLGVAYWNREQGEEAINSYRLAIELDPQGSSMWSLYALENLAEVYTRTDHAEEARKAYRSALARETRPEWMVRIQNQIAELDLALGDYQPDEATLYNERGEIIGGVGPGQMHTNRNFEIARQTNDPTKEEKYYRLAIDTDPQMYQPYFNLGLALVRQGRYLEAIPWLEKSDVVWKNDADANPLHFDKLDAHGFLALCHLKLGAPETARQHAQRSLGTGQPNYWALIYAQRVKIVRGEVDEALAVLESLARENPEHAETLYALHLAYSALGQAEKARKILIEAIDAIPESHPWMVRLRDEWKRSPKVLTVRASRDG